MLAKKSLTPPPPRPRRSRRPPTPMASLILPPQLPGLRAIAVLICFYRDPDQAPAFHRWEEVCWDNLCVRFEAQSLDENDYPFLYHSVVFCLSDNANGITLFTRSSGGGGTPHNLVDDKAVVADLLRALHNFPRGWTQP